MNQVFFIATEQDPNGFLTEGSRLYFKPEDRYVAVLDENGRPVEAYFDMLKARNANAKEIAEWRKRKV
jgi:hypothetical protein